jgi:hypothetical protein
VVKRRARWQTAKIMLSSSVEVSLFFVVWEFRVKSEHIADFERHYAPDGSWAKLFREDPAYEGTTLLRDPKVPGRYLTTDVWLNESSYQAFQERSRERYRELDAAFAAYTTDEKLIGHFEAVI